MEKKSNCIIDSKIYFFSKFNLLNNIELQKTIPIPQIIVIESICSLKKIKPRNVAKINFENQTVLN